jgi:hypothetical protein
VIAGHTARKYDYTYRSSILAHAGEGERGGFGMRVVGEAWYAEAGPYADDVILRNLFRKLAPRMVVSALGGSSADRSSFGTPGVLLRVREAVTVFLYPVGVGGPGEPILTGSSLDEVTEITRQPLADSLFGALEQPRQACDCSCAAFDELKAIAKLPKAKQEAHPKAMSLSMCAPECGMRWATQCKRK